MSAWFWMDENKPLLSIEAALGILVALIAAIADLGWELRSILVAFAVGLVAHIARRLNGGAMKRFGLAVVVIVALFLVTWRPIWEDFHKNFPRVGVEAALSRVVIAAVVFAIGLAGYWFIIRPRGKGWRVIPVQLMTFGVCVVGLGLGATAIGLIWQFQQNHAIGIPPATGPTLLPAPSSLPQLQKPSQPALPAPPAAVPQESEPLMSGYNLTSAGSRVLREEAFKIKGLLPGLTVLSLIGQRVRPGIGQLDRQGVQPRRHTQHNQLRAVRRPNRNRAHHLNRRS